MFDHQLYCVGKGLDYPAGDIEGYIDDNKALMRRMYGNLVAEEQPEPEPQVDHRTPASTRPLPEVQFQSRGVRNFAGRFKRDVLEGKLKFIKKNILYRFGGANDTLFQSKISSKGRGSQA